MFLNDKKYAQCKSKASLSFFLFKIYLFVYLFILFLAALGPHCTRVSFTCLKRRLRFVAVRGLLIAVASLVAEHGL